MLKRRLRLAGSAHPPGVQPPHDGGLDTDDYKQLQIQMQMRMARHGTF
jgi:hypothetical protein